ncbi:MAG: hypothetical protein ACLTAI_13615 [Thomasclavelia sp.]
MILDITFNIIIPQKEFNEISRIIEKDENIDLYVSDRKALFIFDTLKNSNTFN